MNRASRYYLEKKALIRAIDQVRDLHSEWGSDRTGASGVCQHCREDYPCTTIQALEVKP